MPLPVNAELSAKRRAAGILGAAARWGNGTSNGKNGKAAPSANSKTHAGSWYRIENKAEGDAADIYIYDEISLWGVSAQDFVDELKNVTASTLNVYINSPGGDVWDGLAILNALRRHSATVNVVVDGMAASAASFIAQAGDTVIMSPNSRMMIHDALGLCIGNAADMHEFAEILDSESHNIASIYAKAAGARGGSADVDEWRATMRAEKWMSDQEAVDVGLADRVAGADDDEDDTEPAPPGETETAKNRFFSMLERSRRRLESTSRPATHLEPPAPTEPTEPAPVFQFDPDIFRKAMKEAAQ